MRALLVLVVLFGCNTSPVKERVVVRADDFHRPTQSAIKIINGFVGCDFLAYGGKAPNVIVKSDDGEPCGLPFHPNIDDGHSATAYRCSDGTAQILIALPGDLHDQACIVAHELGHTLGLKDAKMGIMNQYNCNDFIRVSDADVAFLKARHCE